MQLDQPDLKCLSGAEMLREIGGLTRMSLEMGRAMSFTADLSVLGLALKG